MGAMKLSLRVAWASLAIAGVGLTLAPVSATIAAQQPIANNQSEEVDPVISAFFEQLYRRDYEAALASAGKLRLPKDSDAGRALVQSMRGSALLGLKRDKEAQKAFDEAHKLDPNLPVVDQLQFEAGVLIDDIPVAANALDRLIARFPDAVRGLEAEMVWYFLRNEPAEEQARNENRRVLLAKLGFGGNDGDYLTEDAVRILLKGGDVAGAGDFLKYIDEPSIVENMLIQRRFAPLWPTLERLAGPELETIRASSVKTAEDAVAQEPQSRKALQSLANALRHAGRLDDAIELGSRLPPTTAAMADADEDTGWLVNNVAMALHQAGRADEADALFARLNDAKIPDARWRVSMDINRVELLIADGKFDIVAIVELTSHPCSAGSPR